MPAEEEEAFAASKYQPPALYQVCSLQDRPSPENLIMSEQTGLLSRPLGLCSLADLVVPSETL